MGLNNPRSSFGSAAEFQSSGLPWTTSSLAPITAPVRHDFLKITRSITIRNLASGSTQSLAVGFTRNGIMGTNRFVITPNGSETFETRVKSLFVMSLDTTTVPYSIFAGLTTVDANEMPLLSGTLGNGDAGWNGVG